MTISIDFKQKREIKSDTVVVGIYENNRLTPAAEQIDRETSALLSTHIKNSKIFKGKLGQTISIPVLPENGYDRIILLGLGNPAELDSKKGEIAGGKLFVCCETNGCEKITLYVNSDQSIDKITEEELAAHLGLGFKLRSYKFHTYKSETKEEDKKPVPLKLEIISKSDKAAKKLYANLDAVSEGVFLARNLMNEPANVLYPEHYAQLIKEELRPLGVEVEIIDAKKMAKLDFGAHLAVGQGSDRPPCVVIMHWKGSQTKTDEPPIAFVGKGVTFDTGGISIKPSASMEEMKMDMGGSAAVSGLMKSLALRKSKSNVIGIIGLAENMPSHNAYRPGDIVKSMSGKTIEVLNTDAEGRLVLVDALTYVQKTYNPKIVIDLATLTGAIMVALGHEYGGAFVNDDSLWQKLEEASAQTGEKLWRMPLDESYKKEMEGNLSDLQNLGSQGRYGGACSAAGFLEHFIDKDRPWAHLDIAGMMNWKKEKPTNPKGPPGFGVRVLDKMISNNYEN
jgi:leucyl aminopeptidase